MTGDLTADEICRLLELEPNATCGFVRVTFVSKQSIAAGKGGQHDERATRCVYS